MQCRADDVCGGGVHARYDRHVVGPQPVGTEVVRVRATAGGALHRIDELPGVDRQQLIVGCATRGHEAVEVVEQAEPPNQLKRQLEPARVERMLRGEAVLGEGVIPDECSAWQRPLSCASSW